MCSSDLATPHACKAGPGGKSDHVAGPTRAWLTTAQTVIVGALPAPNHPLFSGLLRAAIDALWNAAVAFGRGRNQALFTEIRQEFPALTGG